MVGYGLGAGRPANEQLMRCMERFLFRHIVSTAWNFGLSPSARQTNTDLSPDSV